MKTLSKILIPLIFLAACQTGRDLPDAYGSLEATETFISTELPGKITWMSVHEGDEVQENTLLSQQDTVSYFLQKGQVLASIAALKSKLSDVPVQLDVLKQKSSILSREIDRIKLLVKGGAATTKQLDDLQGEYDLIKKQQIATESQLSTGNRSILAQISPLEWQLRQIEEQIKKAAIFSPKSGTVLSRLKEPGEFSGPGTPIYKIANLDLLTARIYVTADQLIDLKIGQEVSVSTDAQEGEMISTTGKVTWIASQAEFTPKTIQTREERVNLVYAVKVSVPNSDRSLKIGMPVEITF